MDSNTYSVGAPAGLPALVAELQGLAAQDVGGLADGALVERVMTLRGLVDRLEGHWLADLAAGWLRHRLRMGAVLPPAWCADRPGAVSWPLTGTARP